MYCTHCGAQNPDDYRFCHQCGKPRKGVRQPSEVPAGREETGGGLKPGRVRMMLFALAIDAAEKGVDNPWTLINLEAYSDTLGFLQNPTDEQLDELFSFSEDEERAMDRERFYTYTQMLWTYAKAAKSEKLMKRVFEKRDLTVWEWAGDLALEDKNWVEYEQISQAHLEEAREIGVAIYMLKPLLNVARAKFFQRDWGACRRCLKEFDQVMDRARREKTEHVSISELETLQVIQVMKEGADHLRKYL